MSGPFYTVDQAADRLKLHPKTVLRMIHDGRIKAARLGKAYRIAGADLDATVGVVRAEVRECPDRATVIADFGDLSPDLASRLGNTLGAMLNNREARPDPVRLQSSYDPDLRRLKVVVMASPDDAATLLKSAVFLLDSWR